MNQRYDPAVTERMRQFLESSEKDWAEGADIILKVSANRIRHAMYLRGGPDKYAADIEKRIRELYTFRLAKVTHRQVVEMSGQASRIASGLQESEDTYRAGKRPDHDTLPQEIQAVYIETLSILRMQREIHMQIRRIANTAKPGTCTDSELFPFVKEIIRLDKKRLSLWQKYDTYKTTQQ